MTKYTPPEEAGGASLSIKYKLPSDLRAKLSEGQRDFFNALPEKEKRQLLKEGGFITSVSSTAEVRLTFAKSGLSRLAGPLKQGKKHALSRAIDILKGRYGP